MLYHEVLKAMIKN